MFRIYVFLMSLVLVVFSSCSQIYTKKESFQHIDKKGYKAEDTTNQSKLQHESLVSSGENIQKASREENLQPLEKEVVITPKEIEQIEKSKIHSQKEESLEKEVPAAQKKLPLNFILKINNTKYTKQYYDYYSNIRKRTFQRWLKRATPYLPYILRTFRKYNIPDDLIFLPFAESGFNPRAYSRAGAAGIWQFMPATARKYGLSVNWWIDERLDPFRSTIAAAKYLSDLHDMFGDWYLALAAYNAGEGRVIKAIKRSKKNDFFHIAKPRYLKRETRMYVPKFMAILKIIQNLELLGFEPLCFDEKKVPVRVFVREGTDLYTFAKKLGLSWKDFRMLNPHFRRYVTPPSVMSLVYVPKNLEAKAKELIKTKGVRPYGGLYRYRVKNGDSWWRLSRRFGVPIKILKTINRTRSNLLRPGRSILIPKSRRFYLAKNKTYIHKTKKSSWASIRGNYIVKKGDTLWGISRRFSVPLNTIRVANNLSRRAILRPGMRLYIPKQDYNSLNTAQKALKEILYRVKRGDNLWHIARKFGVTTNQLLTWNNLKKNSRIYPGDKLKILVEVVEN